VTDRQLTLAVGIALAVFVLRGFVRASWILWRCRMDANPPVPCSAAVCPDCSGQALQTPDGVLICVANDCPGPKVQPVGAVPEREYEYGEPIG
jgi:hypothetical protein